MACENFRKRIEEILDKDMQPGSGLAEHLESCAECSRHYHIRVRLAERLRKDAAALSGPLPNGFEERVIQAVSSDAKGMPRRNGMRAIFWKGLAAAACLALLLGGWGWMRRAHEMERRRQAARTLIRGASVFFEPLDDSLPLKRDPAAPSAMAAGMDGMFSVPRADLNAAATFIEDCLPFSLQSGENSPARTVE
jgi:hypothetical protein